jgi:Fe2+ or Zn2+ uptake regulation protein
MRYYPDMDAELKLFRKTLKKNGYFNTAARYRLFTVLQDHTSLTIRELIAKLDKHDQATVYRNIKLFEELGIINRLRLGWNSKLELSDIFHHHHHHFTCLNCGKVMILKDNPALERQISVISHKGGFQPLDHQLEIRGYCKECQKNRPR